MCFFSAQLLEMNNFYDKSWRLYFRMKCPVLLIKNPLVFFRRSVGFWE